MFGLKKIYQGAGRTDLSAFSLLPKKRVQICSADFRDGQQSLYATRFYTKEILPVIPQMDQLGYASMEMWGGATFDVCMRYLNDDPWERLRQIKAGLKNTPTMMLLRGQNLVGYRQYADDVVEKFVDLAAKNGIDIFVVFDGLNDARNCETAIRAVKKNKKTCCGSILYTVSPIHNIKKLVETGMDYKKMGVDYILLADMAGQMTPNESYKSVKALKEATGLPIQVSFHATGGMAYNAYWEAVRAGADILTCCVSNLSGGTSLPSAEVMNAMLKGSGADPKMDMGLLEEVNEKIGEVCRNHQDVKSQFTGVNVKVLKHQVPGGMLSNLESQLKAMNMLHRIDEVFQEVQVVRRDMGYPPLATPFSQMVGAQATANVLTGKRYSILSREVKEYVRGAYGKTPGEIAPELKELVLGGESQVIACRPGSILSPEWDKGVKGSAGFAACEEDVMSYILFPAVAEGYLKKKYGKN